MAVALGVLSCTDKEPSGSIVQFPVKALVVTVDGADYTAVPKINPDKSFNDTLTFNSIVRSEKATIKRLELANPGATTSVSEGEQITFDWDKYIFTVNTGGREHKYCLSLNYTGTTPDFMYVVKESDTNGSTDFYVDPGENQKIVSVNNNYKFEGYVDLNDAGNDKIGIVNSFISKYYGVADNFGTSDSYGTFTLTEGPVGANNSAPSPGPSNSDWAIDKGIWKMNYEAATGELTMLNTVWAVEGSATGASAVPMEYDPVEKKWKLTGVELGEGAFKFTTLPVTPGDPTVTYGVEKGKLTETETASGIAVSEAGEYNITLDLSNAGRYTYTLLESGVEPPAYPFMYMVWTGNIDISADTPILISGNDDDKFEGYVYMGDANWKNVGFVSSDRSRFYTGQNGYTNQSYGINPLNAPVGSIGNPSTFWNGWALDGHANVWKFNVDLNAMTATFLCTDWAIEGTATGGVKPMTYNKTDKKWSVTTTLAAGSFKFTTIPANSNSEDPMITYGLKADTTDGLSEDGSAITVAAGEYTITLDLSNAPEYKFSLGDDVGPGPDPDPESQSMYVVWTGNETISAGTRTLADEGGNDKFEGYIDGIGSWNNVVFVSSDQSQFYHVGNAGFNASYGSKILMAPAGYLSTGDGMWNAWAGFGQGVWRFSVDLDAMSVTALCTDWAIEGTATSGAEAMAYNAAEKKWTITTTLAAGDFKFKTIPVTGGDPTVTYGLKTGTTGGLSEEGSAITVAAGAHTVTLDLSSPRSYSFTIE